MDESSVIPDRTKPMVGIVNRLTPVCRAEINAEWEHAIEGDDPAYKSHPHVIKNSSTNQRRQLKIFAGAVLEA